MSQAATAPRFGVLETGDGGVLRHACWCDPGRPARATVVLLNGRCEFIERYQELAGEWLDRGYQVFALDWRGQGLSSRFLANPQKGHVPDYGIYDADLALFLDRVVLPAVVGPLVLFAHSMSALAALQAVIEHPGRFAAVILSAPMLDILTTPYPRGVAKAIALVATRLGFDRWYAFGQHDYDPAEAEALATNPMTGDAGRYRAYHELLRLNPALRVGGVTFGWLAATFRAIDRRPDPEQARRIAAPVLILSAPADTLVPVASHHRLAALLPTVTLCSYPQVRHEPLMENDAIRAQVWADIDRFLGAALKS